MPNFKVVLVLAAIVVPLLISHFAGGWVSVYTSHGFSVSQIPRLDGKVAIVTGANTGIGKITVRDLAEKGAQVVLASRSISKGEAARQEVCDHLAKSGITSPCSVSVMALDLASLSSVLAFSEQITSQFDHIDMLILNAGIMFGDYAMTAEGYERQWGTNHLGHFFLVERLMPLLGEGSRVVSVSSSAHQGPYSAGIAFDQLESDLNYNPFLAYGQSKLANILFASELSERYASKGLTSNSLHPGVIKTELMRHANQGIVSMFPAAIAEVMLQIENAAYNVMFMTPDQGALTQLYVATAPELAGVTGKFFKPVGVQTSPSALGTNKELQRRLWEVSAGMTARFMQAQAESQ